MTVTIPLPTVSITEPSQGDITVPWYDFLNEITTELNNFGSVSTSSGASTGSTGSTGGSTGGFITSSEMSALLGVYPVSQYGALGDGVTDDTAAIQAAIDAAAQNNGGIVFFDIFDDTGTAYSKGYRITDTLLISTDHITLQGISVGRTHNVSANVPTTWIWWDGAAHGTMVKFATPVNASGAKIAGGGLKRMMLYGNAELANGADYGLELVSYSNGSFEDLIFAQHKAGGIATSCLNDAQLGEETNTNANRFFRCVSSQLGTGTTTSKGWLLQGGDTGNTSFNEFSHCYALHQNGAGFYFDNTDNNIFNMCGTFSSGTGWGFDIQGGTLFDGQNSNNTFIGCTWPFTRGFRCRGTEAYTYATVGNHIITRDFLNSAGAPTMGTGCRVIDYTENHTNHSWTPTVAATAGAIGGHSILEAAYANHFTEFQFTAKVRLSSVGTASGYLLLQTMPRAASYYTSMSAYHLTAAVPLICVIGGGDDDVYVGNTSGATFPTTGDIAISGRYFTA